MGVSACVTVRLEDPGLLLCVCVCVCVCVCACVWVHVRVFAIPIAQTSTAMPYGAVLPAYISGAMYSERDGRG